jgi:hypothetical protein
VKKETTGLLFLLLLATGPVGAQADLSDEDLQSLLNESSSEISDMAKLDDSNVETLSEPSLDVVIESPGTDFDTDNSADPIDLSGLESTPQKNDFSLEQDDDNDKTFEPAPKDDLESLKADLGDDELKPVIEAPQADLKKKTVQVKETEPAVFDVGREERELLSLAQNIQGQISDNEWNEVATAAKVESYTVVKDDWLFKISKRLFGTGFFYPKIWSLNSYITNPHFIEPGMVLSFTTGSGSNAPAVKLGAFTKDEINAVPGSIGNQNPADLANFGEEAKPKWIDEKNELSSQGIYFQYASDETMEDLVKASEEALNREYENYEPPRSDFEVVLPKNFDKSGFDKNSRIFYSVKEGFYLSTFISTNIVQDFGAIVSGPDENIFFTRGDRAYVQFDESMNVLSGDRFSIYTSGGKVNHSNSDRQGFKYSIVGQIKLLRKIKDKWEVEFIEVSGTPQRGDRITSYTPKIDRITKTYNSRMVEAAVLGTYQPNQNILAFGDVIYLDRGRADGVELGNVFEVYGFKDRHTNKNITDQPTYKTGELTVITLTDNFATALVSASVRDFYTGDIAITKTKESFLREQKARADRARGEKEMMGGKALEELDVELNLENLNDDLLKQADKIQLTEDELAELERQEREKSIIKDSERDLKALERLENEIEQAEKILNDAKLDEDKLLENENLNDIEKKRNNVDDDSLDEIEENLGKRYIDEDLNSKDNPFGLSEFDVEEIDELLNTEKKQ